MGGKPSHLRTVIVGSVIGVLVFITAFAITAGITKNVPAALLVAGPTGLAAGYLLRKAKLENLLHGFFGNLN